MRNSGTFRIGNQTAFAARSPLEPFEFAVAHGFNAFEFFPDRGLSGQGGWDERDVDRTWRKSVAQLAADHDIQLTVHAPLELNLLRDRRDGRLYSAVEFAWEIGATLINLHLDVTEGIERFVEAMGPALELTAQAALKLALENTVFTGPQDFNEFFAALRRRPEGPAPHVGMTLDLGHANLYAALRNDYLRYVDSLEPDVPIIHLHLHENYGDRDSHLTLFTGPARTDITGIGGLVDRMLRRGFAGCAILEQWPQPPSLLIQARDALRHLLALRAESLSLA